MVFLGRDLIDRNQYSEDSAKKIDQEVSKLINSAYQKAEKILAEKKEKLTQIAEVLIEKETIEKDEFKELMKTEN